MPSILPPLPLIGSSLDNSPWKSAICSGTEVSEALNIFLPTEGLLGNAEQAEPYSFEHIAGLARILRANALAPWKCGPWHERDISHSR